MEAALAFGAEGTITGRMVGDLVGKPPPQRPAGRVLADPDCTALLSIYNVEADCCAPCQQRSGTIVRCVGAST